MPKSSILITGCSSGIGRYAATALQARGYRVFATARKKEDVSALKAAGFESLQLDVTQQESIDHALQTILAATGGTLDVLFNNAGFYQTGAIEDLTPALTEQQFATNVWGPLALTRAVLPIMREQGQGRIIQNSSILGIMTIPCSGVYCASKYALEAFTLALRQELRGTNIKVACINPGPVISQLRQTAYRLYQTSIQQQKDNVYAAQYQQMEEAFLNNKRDRFAVDPEKVLKPLLHALESKHPRTHYYIGLPAQFAALAKRFLPDFALEWLLSRR